MKLTHKPWLMLSVGTIALVAGCTTPPLLCDREAIGWDKWGEASIPVECQDDEPVSWAGAVHYGNDDDQPNPPMGGPYPDETDTPDEPDAPDAPDEPVDTPTRPEQPSRPDTGRPQGDNSDANGKGGNRHNREDFTHGGTETAEDRKGG